MPADLGTRSERRFGVAFIISAEVVFAIIAFACSSPQTAEINIRKRGDTLMKWVHIGQALSALTIIIAASADKRDRMPILMGGVYAMVSAEILYAYAKRCGENNPGAETETY